MRENLQLWFVLLVRSRNSGREDELRNKLQLPSIPLVELTVAAAGDSDDHVEARHDNNELPAISFC